ncbi:MAG: hypothetical protein DMG65_22900 [Candidatus Angelobacter sp. Gp1-AA117]|nr:MAG: hypothetical protein DMG65_22900 [Candidatus Angelobacter sp. Gp1-AA117]
MKKTNLFAALCLLIFGTVMMQAQASRTWVSGVGDDANPCSRTAPCKTFAGAISKTAAGGEIDALDPAGYGAVTITKAITIDGGGGQVASVLVSGTNGIVVQAGPSDVVILRNLRINGIGTGINGIRFLSGKNLNVENCYIFGFTTNGIDVALNQATQASVHVLNSVIKNVGQVGIKCTNAVAPSVNCNISNTAVILDQKGAECSTNCILAVTDSVFSQATSDGITFDTPSSTGQVVNSRISFNQNGLTATLGGSASASRNSYISNTSCSMNNNGGAFLRTFSNNDFSGATTCGTITPTAPQ